MHIALKLRYKLAYNVNTLYGRKGIIYSPVNLYSSTQLYNFYWSSYNLLKSL